MDEPQKQGGMYEHDAPPAYEFTDANKTPGSYSSGSGRECFELNADWGVAGVTGKAGACWDCFKLEPCCGEPCNVADGCYCCCCYTCCGICMQTKLLAYSLDEECHIVNHCGVVCLFICLLVVAVAICTVLTAFVSPYFYPAIAVLGILPIMFYMILRRNIRMKYNVGSPNSWIGDLFMVCCCCTSLCSMCQELRAVPIEGWDWFRDVKENGIRLIDNTTLGNLLRK